MKEKVSMSEQIPEQQILTEKFFEGKCLFLETTREERDKYLGKIDFTEERRYCSKCGYWTREYDLNKVDEYKLNKAGEYTCGGHTFGKELPRGLRITFEEMIEKALKEGQPVPKKIFQCHPELVKEVKNNSSIKGIPLKELIEKYKLHRNEELSVHEVGILNINREEDYTYVWTGLPKIEDGEEYLGDGHNTALKLSDIEKDSGYKFPPSWKT